MQGGLCRSPVYLCRNCSSAAFSSRQTVAGLTPREKRIMELRYLKGETQMEVAREIGISQAQVSRLEKAALEQFRHK